MGILIGEDTRVIVQGMTGKEGTHHTKRMITYGTDVVGGVTPGKGGDWYMGKPIFETVQNAVNATGANTSVIFVPPASAADAIYEAIDADIHLIVCPTVGIPLLDAVRVREYIRLTHSRLLGPSSPGVLVPGIGSLGTIPPEVATPGHVGIVSRSSSLAYIVANNLTHAGIGQSAIIGIGGDTVLGTNFLDVLTYFEDDPYTRFVVLLGEIGGNTEQEAASYIAQMTKPVIAYVAGRNAPTHVRMGHHSAIITDFSTTAVSKIEQLQKMGAIVMNDYEKIPSIIMDRIQV